MKAAITATRAILAALGLSLMASLAGAQDAAPYPSRTIRIIVPATPGGTTDVIARIFADKLGASLGQTVLVDYKPGANGILAVQAAARAPADGYTLFMGYTAYTQNLALRADTPYKASDLTGVAQVMNSSIVFAVPTTLGVNTLAGFIALARSKPKAYSFGTTGVGSTPHLFGELLNRAAGTDMVAIPYKGEAQIINDLLGGQLAGGWGAAGSYLPYVKAGKLALLAVTGARRVAAVPEVPTFKELGYAGLDINGWNGMLVPAGTPSAIITRLSDEIVRITHLPEVSARLIEFGFEPVGAPAPAFTAFLAEDLRRWTAAVKLTGIKAE